MLDDYQRLRKVVVALEAMNVDADVEYPGVIIWHHDDLTIMAGTANGTLDVDVYEDNDCSEVDDGQELQYMTTASSGFKLDVDPQVAAAFIKGVIQSRIV